MLNLLLLFLANWVLILALAILGRYAGKLIGNIYARLCNRFDEERVLRVIVWLMTSFWLAIGATILSLAIYQVHNA